MVRRGVVTDVRVLWVLLLWEPRGLEAVTSHDDRCSHLDFLLLWDKDPGLLGGPAGSVPIREYARCAWDIW